MKEKFQQEPDKICRPQSPLKIYEGNNVRILQCSKNKLMSERTHTRRRPFFVLGLVPHNISDTDGSGDLAISRQYCIHVVFPRPARYLMTDNVGGPLWWWHAMWTSPFCHMQAAMWSWRVAWQAVPRTIGTHRARSSRTDILLDREKNRCDPNNSKHSNHCQPHHFIIAIVVSGSIWCESKGYYNT